MTAGVSDDVADRARSAGRRFFWRLALRSNHYDYAPASYRVLDELVCSRDIVQPKRFGDLKARPSGFERPIDLARCFNLGRGRDVITADKEEFRVAEDELPEWNLRRRSIAGVSGDRAALRQDLNIHVDILREGYFDDVIDALRGDTADAPHQGGTI